MSLRSDFRASLSLKIRDTANSLGQTDFSTTELNEMLANAPRRLFPDLYQRKELGGQASTNNGVLTPTDNTIDAQRITAVYDETNFDYVRGWRPRGTTKLVDVDSGLTNLTIEYYGPYVMPTDDVTATGIPDEYYHCIVIQAAIDGMERWAADRVDYTGYQPNSEVRVDENEVLNYLVQLENSLEKEMKGKYMTLPPWQGA